MSFQMNMPRVRRRLVLFATGIGLLVVGYMSYDRAAPAQVNQAANPVPVQIAQVTGQNMPVWISSIGSVQPLSRVNIRVRADGELTSIHFAEGQMVEANALLATIDSRGYKAQFAQSQAVVARDQAQIKNLKVNLDRATKLAQAKAGPTQDVDTFAAQLAAEQASLQADQAALDSAQLQLSFTEIRAPFAGRTGQRQLDVGSIIHGNEATGLVTLTQMNPITVSFAVSQDELPGILQQQARAPLQVVAMSADGQREISRGKLTFIDSQVAAASGQIQLKAQFENAQQQLWPGQLVSARVLVDTLQNVTAIPAGAVQMGRDGNYVYVVTDQQQVEVRKVDAAPLVVGGEQWIRDGLKVGEKVIANGQSRVKPGSKVADVKQQDVVATEAAQ